jgi:uncharacterized membrane protein
MDTFNFWYILLGIAGLILIYAIIGLVKDIFKINEKYKHLVDEEEILAEQRAKERYHSA